jgi:high-affinity iron transporter
MLATLIIVFREMIEAGLVVGIVLAATRGTPKCGRWVSYGIIGGIIGACVIAIFANSISNALEGMGQEMFNVSVLLIAVLMLTWHNVWMARHGREIAKEMKALGQAVVSGQRSLIALSIVVGIAILREGAEIVLFMYGIAASGNESVTSMAIGGILGVVMGGCLSALIYFGLLRIHTRHLFKVTSWLIALLAAGMATQAVSFLQQAGMITIFTQTIWDTSNIISNDSIPGKILHALVGYTDQPTLIQLIIYALTLFVIFMLMRLFGHANSQKQAAI